MGPSSTWGWALRRSFTAEVFSPSARRKGQCKANVKADVERATISDTSSGEPLQGNWLFWDKSSARPIYYAGRRRRRRSGRRRRRRRCVNKIKVALSKLSRNNTKRKQQN